jgi:hypothetical protein
MKKIIIILFFISSSVYAADFKTEKDALDFCLTIHDEINTPKQIKQIIKKSMRSNCLYSQNEDGTFYVSAGSFYKLNTLDDLNSDKKKDYILILGSTGNGGNYYSLLLSDNDEFNELGLGMTQGLYFDKVKEQFIYSTHGSVCDQSGHIPCFFIRTFDGKQVSDPKLIKDYAEKYGKPWDSKDENLLSLDAD